MIEEEARLSQEEGQVAVWEKTIGSVDLGFIYPPRRASEPLIKALVEGIRQVWKVTEIQKTS